MKHITDFRERTWLIAKLILAGFTLVVGLLSTDSAVAGPPFLTDDPEPVAYHHYEFYLFGIMDSTRDDTTVQAPAIEFNYGVLPETQLHIIAPYTNNFPQQGSAGHGLGDIEAGIKYRLVRETGSVPQIGIFPMVELPTGSAAKGLGNGMAWYRLPVWLQKSFGTWTTYGGGGYVINPAPGMRDYWFAGWLLQKDLSNKLTLGGELFAQGPDTVNAHYTVIANAGGFWNFTPDFSLLFSAGHSVAGEEHTVAYLSLYWTW